MAETRKLAAILAADVVGFSRLAGADEDRTLARLRALRSDLIDPTIAIHNGRVFKRTGDGILIEFRSVVDAVRCAIEVQTGMIERNAGLPPERRIEFRVGDRGFIRQIRSAVNRWTKPAKQVPLARSAARRGFAPPPVAKITRCTLHFRDGSIAGILGRA
jgi:hypothetical protein